MRFACSLQVFASLFFAFFAYFRFKFFASIRFNTVAYKNFQCEWRNAKSVTPINPPLHPNCPNLFERSFLKSDTVCVLSCLGGCVRNSPSAPPPPNPLLWGKGEEGIIIFDVLNSLLNQIQIFFKDITMQLHSGAKLFGSVIVLYIELTSKYHIVA